MPFNQFFSKAGERTEIKVLQEVICRWNFQKKAIQFFVPNQEEQKILHECAQKGLKTSFDTKNSYLSALDRHAALSLLKLKLEIIKWDYSIGFFPLMRTETAPNPDDLKKLSENEEKETGIKPIFQEYKGFVYSGNHRTTKFLLANGFSELTEDIRVNFE